MPDLDDIFEDAVDAIKKITKRWRKTKKPKKQDNRAKESRKDEPPQGGPTLFDRLFSNRPNQVPGQRGLEERGGQRAATLVPSARNPATVQDSTLRGYLDQAQAYERGIIGLMQNAPTDFNRSRMEELTQYVAHWQGALQALVERVEQFNQNELIQRDLKQVPKAIKRIETQLADAPTGQIAQALERTLNNRQQQLTSLNNLRDTIQWAEVKIENTLSMLGTIYSQAIMSQSTGQVGNYTRLLAEIEEEALSLDDYVNTLQEIKFEQPA